ncbi:uncharacterized protein LOC5505641 isoform X1 [Nematostella vectensis]|uniref:uncharacterized protein LOC5505641 isoform X1 n=1 Tax=Nematostella vectensis TaxID=45351 RepID=UPI00207796C4|nr:uncharacterized protein LOC5505641 isoform X1 [Nematostella vectensis]XP_048583907.1 uncharacterized protein LOC5505641 isoform X1 [Nematostella vectensis]
MASDKAKTSSYVSDLTAVPLQKIVENRPLLDKLRCLDIEYKEKCNWQHLAHSFKVPQDVCKRLSSYHRQSPTKKLFFYLLSYRSDLPISELKQALKNIYRADLLSCIKDLKDDALVSDVITKTSVLETLAIELDVDTMPAPQGNWESLAHEVGIRDHLILAVIRSEYNPAEKLLEYLSSTSPDLAIGTLKAHLKSMNRGDILDLLREHKEDETLRDVIKLGTDLQFKVTHSLNNHNGWQILADKLDVPAEVVDGIRPPNERDVHSPSQGLLRFLSRERPHMTAQHLVDNLNEINRADAVWFITTHFSLPIKDETSFRERTASCPALGERHTHSRPTLQTRASTPGTPSLTAEGSAPSILPGLQESHQQDVSICHGRLSQIPFGSHGCNLERKPDIFIGREKAQASLITALLSLEHPMIGVCGVSGFGKTTLCVNASYELIEKGHFVAYVNSRHVHCTDNLAEKILREFGMTGTGSADPVRQAISLLKSFNRDVILIIENVDKMLHLFQREDKVTAIKKESRIKVDESQQILSSSSNFGTMCSKQPESSEKSFLEFITDIATYCPRIKLLVTCWERVDYFNFTVKNIELKPLTLKDSVKLLQVKSEKETGKMMPREQAEKIALYCDGYPLLLCGSSVQDLPELTRNIAPAEVHGMLDSDKKTRKRVDWCFNKIFERMDKDVRRVLVMMSVFPESFTVSDATIVTQGIKAEVVEFCLKKLTNKHCFSRYNPDTNAYTLHSAVRLFGTRKGNDDIYRELYSLSRKRFIEHYIGKLELYDGKYFSKNSQEAVQAYRQAKYNIRQIIEWCVWENKPPLDPALKLQCIDTFIDSALFLIKMMSTEEFRTQFLLLANQCESNAKRQSALFVYQGAMNVISCTCYPNICPTWLLLALHYFEKARELNIETMKCSER